MKRTPANAARADRGQGGTFAEAYARWRKNRLGQITEKLEEKLILELLGPVDGLDVLDVGCGDGALAARLARHGARVTGIDAEPQMLAVARKREEALMLIEGRAEALPFRDHSFDRITAVTVLCFVDEPDRAIAEMARVLRPGGRLVIGELGRWSLWAAVRRVRGWIGAKRWKAAHFRTAGKLTALLEKSALAVEQTRGAIFYPPFDIAATLLAPIDPWLGRRTAAGAAFIALSAAKPMMPASNESR